jgi:uncharacterized repeat protein (TIGR03803 family)
MKRILPAVLLIMILTIASAFAPSVGAASKFETIHTFVGLTDGVYPYAGLTYDSAGNLYGTTKLGGDTKGTAFELKRNSDGTWAESVIYVFSGTGSGYYPMAGLTLDSAGNLYGTLSQGGANHNAGQVYELTPDGNGTWTEKVLYNFCSLSYCADGSTSYANVIFDQNGNLYGTTAEGGASDSGTVFKLTPNGSGGWAESVIYSFSPTEGGEPLAGVIFDQAGKNLYGTGFAGGRGQGFGVVFRLSPNQNGSWTYAKLYQFCRLENCRDGGNPWAGLTFDSAGNLYGSTKFQGAHGDGVVFELSPTVSGPWDERVLYQFTGGDDGGNPQGGVTFDSAGKLYGTTYYGGGSTSCKGGCGVVFKLVRDPNGDWHETAIHALSPATSNPAASLVFNGSVLYGTSSGASGTGQRFGAVFEVIP